MTKKPTKNIITRASVEEELRFLNTADIRFIIAEIALFSLLLVPLTVLLLWSAFAFFSPSPIVIVISFLLVIALDFPYFIEGRNLARRFTERKQIKKGEFEITRSQLSYKNEVQMRRHSEYRFYFSRFAHYVVGKSRYELFEGGDEFYLVHYRKGDVIQIIYPLKTHEYQEAV